MVVVKVFGSTPSSLAGSAYFSVECDSANDIAFMHAMRTGVLMIVRLPFGFM